MRHGCYDCARKHLGQASVLYDESILGYPEHRWLAIGHLAEAESEFLEIDPGMSAQIREHRVNLIDDPDYAVPFLSLIEIIGKMKHDADTRVPRDNNPTDPSKGG